MAQPIKEAKGGFVSQYMKKEINNYITKSAITISSIDHELKKDAFLASKTMVPLSNWTKVDHYLNNLEGCIKYVYPVKNKNSSKVVSFVEFGLYSFSCHPVSIVTKKFENVPEMHLISSSFVLFVQVNDEPDITYESSLNVRIFTRKENEDTEGITTNNKDFIVMLGWLTVNGHDAILGMFFDPDNHISEENSDNVAFNFDTTFPNLYSIISMKCAMNSIFTATSPECLILPVSQSVFWESYTCNFIFNIATMLHINQNPFNSRKFGDIIGINNLQYKSLFSNMRMFVDVVCGAKLAGKTIVQQKKSIENEKSDLDKFGDFLVMAIYGSEFPENIGRFANLDTFNQKIPFLSVKPPKYVFLPTPSNGFGFCEFFTMFLSEKERNELVKAIKCQNEDQEPMIYNEIDWICACGSLSENDKFGLLDSRGDFNLKNCPLFETIIKILVQIVTKSPDPKLQAINFNYEPYSLIANMLLIMAKNLVNPHKIKLDCIDGEHLVDKVIKSINLEANSSWLCNGAIEKKRHMNQFNEVMKFENGWILARSVIGDHLHTLHVDKATNEIDYISKAGYVPAKYFILTFGMGSTYNPNFGQPEHLWKQIPTNLLNNALIRLIGDHIDVCYIMKDCPSTDIDEGFLKEIETNSAMFTKLMPELEFKSPKPTVFGDCPLKNNHHLNVSNLFVAENW